MRARFCWLYIVPAFCFLMICARTCGGTTIDAAGLSIYHNAETISPFFFENIRISHEPITKCFGRIAKIESINIPSIAVSSQNAVQCTEIVVLMPIEGYVRQRLVKIEFHQNVLNCRFCASIIGYADYDSPAHRHGYRKLTEPYSDIAALKSLEGVGRGTRGVDTSLQVNALPDRNAGQYEGEQCERCGKCGNGISPEPIPPAFLSFLMAAIWLGLACIAQCRGWYAWYNGRRIRAAALLACGAGCSAVTFVALYVNWWNVGLLLIGCAV